MKRKENLSKSAMLKIEKMYRAVVTLLESGRDINAIKVSDITKEAGIGKGTAYEYFETKEEIIARALHYDMQKQLESLEKCNQSAVCFKEMVMNTLDWIERNLKQKSSGIQFLKATEEAKDLPGELVAEVRKSCGNSNDISRLIRAQLSCARKEDIWKSCVPEMMAELAMFSGYMEYFVWLCWKRERNEISKEEVKEYIYCGICSKLEIKYSGGCPEE